MRLLELTIGTRHFYLPEETDLGDFERAIEDAARSGGGMIGIPGLHREPVSALITPGVPVFIEHVVLADDSGDDDDLTSPIDFDSSFSEWSG
ncbi:hypothetical protein [Rathayibacter sp. VKM Ac-2801]|uniref:hypothetical protein n=1 Tax=Rathayibacter sp. VKM Ac-2801 TaxID=2609255 RepID=UPI00131F92BC|nr:hypothetical protein [Rathayibacter sp. VKM Ac-2801]QHC69736.1 hypothetical protein GSU45_04640 [Rathayibacter sp. VKM Ac-2801]